MQDILDTTDDIPMDEVGKKDIQLFRSRWQLKSTKYQDFDRFQDH
jgi:hypothetical protein